MKSYKLLYEQTAEKIIDSGNAVGHRSTEIVLRRLLEVNGKDRMLPIFGKKKEKAFFWTTKQRFSQYFKYFFVLCSFVSLNE